MNTSTRLRLKKEEVSELDLPAPPALTDGNFHRWEQAVYANLLSKIRMRGIPLAYVVHKDMVPQDFTSEVEHLIYEASRVGLGWDEDNKAVGIYLTSLLMGKPGAPLHLKNLVEPYPYGQRMQAECCASRSSRAS